ncbi:mesothelin-like protein, partial [Clarias gariepinus]|uniref:mesothelin-like protein n=1 Tax=Clarias gariepinus TaxID=13013 RepID=UPI00234E0C28
MFSFHLNVKREILSVLREQKIPIKILRTFFTKCNSEDATVSDISAVTISDPSFPFGFNSTQFDLYLDISVLQYNLAAITEKVVDISLQTVILKKLNQIYPSGLDDGVLQLLGSTSRVATTDDISKWNINMIDTLYSLMDPNNGPWDPHMSQALIMRYLSTEDHYLESAEINAIGSNICTLNVSVLQTITAESLKKVLSPDLSSCSIEQKSVLYIIANSSFSNEHSNTLTFYNFITPYLGGAPLEDIQTLSTYNISMDITVFSSLIPAVVMALNVTTVKALMGVNVADLKLFVNSPAVHSWVLQQSQSELDMLNLDIIKTSSNNYTANISTIAPHTETTTIIAIVTNLTAMTKMNTSAITNAILNTTASPATSFQTTPFVGTTVKTPSTNNTILTTTTFPATSFKAASSVGTTVTMPGTNNSILTTTAPTTTSFKTTSSVETTVKTPGINNTILTTTASPAKSFQTTPSVGTTVKTPGTTVKMPDTNNTILTTTASPATSFKTT